MPLLFLLLVLQVSAQSANSNNLTPKEVGVMCLTNGTPTPAPLGNNCARACPNGVELTCSDTAVGPATSAPCKMKFPSSVCRRLGINSGIVNPKDFSKLFDCSKIEVTDEASGTLYYFCCAIFHELVHACEWRPGTNMLACEERDGNTRMTQCLMRPITEICKEPIPPENRRVCHSLCYMNAKTALFRIWDNCNCNIAATARDCGSEFDKQACCRCNIECKNNPNAYLSRIPNICQSILMPADTNRLLAECENLNKTDHGCIYMSGNLDQKDDPNFCLKIRPTISNTPNY